MNTARMRRSVLLSGLFVAFLLLSVLPNAVHSKARFPSRTATRRIRRSSSEWIYPATRYHSLQKQQHPWGLLSLPRGGSTTVTDASSPDKAYYIQQQLSLQSRSLQLRQALMARGLTELSHTTAMTTADGSSSGPPKQHAVVDWECARSTPDHPKSCLYSLDAEYGQKVIAPRISDADDPSTAPKYAWITLTALNRLYRTDPAKVESLWYHQYDVLNTWFRAHHRYSLYAHYRDPVAALVTGALNLRPAWLLGFITLTTVLGLALLLLFPLLEAVVSATLTSRLLWNAWPTWGRFVHAALPLQLLLGQMALGLAGQVLQLWTRALRSWLVEYECQALQEQLPLTLIETNDDHVEEDMEDDPQEDDVVENDEVLEDDDE